MPKLLWLSDGPYLQTGYATISRKLLNYLSDKGWECYYLSHTSQHATFRPGLTLEDGEKFNFTVLGAGLQPYAKDIIQQRIREIKPDIFGILLDTFMLHPNSHGGDNWFFNLDFSPAKSVFYFPSDGGGGLPFGCDQILRKVDCPIAMSKFAQTQAKELHNLETEYIPHAIEPDVYYPLPEDQKIQLRRKYGLLDKFVVGVVARNQGRKMLDRTLVAFKEVAKQIPNAVLFMHTDKFDPAAYFNFDYYVNKLGLNNRVIWSGMRYFKGLDYKQMNEIYNLMDVFLLGTSGEGFGIPIIEAMACEVTVLATDYTTTPELVIQTQSGEGIKVGEEILGSWHVNRAVMDTKDAAEKVIKLYRNPELRKKYGKNGRLAVLREYTWDNVSDKFDQIFRRLL